MEGVRYRCSGERLPNGKRARCGVDVTELVMAVPVGAPAREVRCPCGRNSFRVERVLLEELERHE